MSDFHAIDPSALRVGAVYDIIRPCGTFDFRRVTLVLAPVFIPHPPAYMNIADDWLEMDFGDAGRFAETLCNGALIREVATDG